MSTIQQTVLGNIRASSSGPLIHYSISCSLEKSCFINCVLLDEQGISLWEQTISYEKGQSNIKLEFPKLKPGSYNCWIEIDGKMHLRPLQVASTKQSGVLGSWMKRFS